MQVPESVQSVAFDGSNESNSCMTSRGWMVSPWVCGTLGGVGAGTAGLREGCGSGPLSSDSTNARAVVVIPSDVATNRPKADGSGSTWTTSAFSPVQRGENERVTRPSNETPTAI